MQRSACVVLVVALGTVACHRSLSPNSPVQPQARNPARVEALWTSPEPNRDLFAGVGGLPQAPALHSRYTFLAVKGRGPGDGYEVADPRQRKWSVNPSPDAQSEVVASRLLWGLGYHQVPVYLLKGWRADGAATPNPQAAARFLPRQIVVAGQTLKETGSWSYAQNPFVGSRELAGLLVLQVMLGNSGPKDDNRLYELDQPVEGSRTWYVAGDLGQTFGRAGRPRSDVDAFEQSKFIAGVRKGVVQFDGPGWHGPLVDRITPADVHWICSRLDHVTERQWRDAFRAGGYQPAVAARFIRKMKGKIAEGLALPT